VLRCGADPLDPFRVSPMALFELPLWAGSTNSGRGASSLNGIEARARTPVRAECALGRERGAGHRGDTVWRHSYARSDRGR